MNILRRLAFVVLSPFVLLVLMLRWIGTGRDIDEGIQKFTEWGTK